jgi:hypothetical protein
MADWDEPCIYDGPAHQFVPLKDGHKQYRGNHLIRAVCQKCGADR